MKRNIIIGVIIVLVGIFVWPGIYKYDKMNQKWPVRINRITGTAEVLYQSGWQEVGNQAAGPQYMAIQSKLINIADTHVEMDGFTIDKLSTANGIAGEIINTSNQTESISGISLDTYDVSGKPINSPIVWFSATLKPNETANFTTSEPRGLGSYKIKINYSLQK